MFWLRRLEILLDKAKLKKKIGIKHIPNTSHTDKTAEICFKMVFTTWLRLNSENYRDVKVKKKPSWVGRNFENLSRNLKTLANNWGNCISVKTSVKYKASRSLLDVNFQAAFARQTASLGDSISTQLCLHSRLSPLFFGKYMSQFIIMNRTGLYPPMAWNMKKEKNALS